MKYFKFIISFIFIFVFAKLAQMTYQFVLDYYTGKPLTLDFMIPYETQLYFFMWIGYALAAAFALIALYCVYFCLSLLLSIVMKKKYWLQLKEHFDKIEMLLKRGWGTLAKVLVKDNETLDDAMRRFKRQVSRNGILAEVRKREFYVKPGVKRKLKREAARKARRRNK